MDRDLLFAIAAAVCGVIGLIKTILDRQGEKIEGIISGFVTQKGNPFPLVRFTYQGKELELSAANADPKRKKTEGERVEIIYKPGNEKYVHIVGEHRDIVICVVLVVAGTVLAICSMLR
ncbi:MAG: hypothetical protein IJ711_12880 [Lachnospiraceae bacterium]|nr:hypothetical protein [Lachnospiraceae bacterium]